MLGCAGFERASLKLLSNVLLEQFPSKFSIIHIYIAPIDSSGPFISTHRRIRTTMTLPSLLPAEPADLEYEYMYMPRTLKQTLARLAFDRSNPACRDISCAARGLFGPHSTDHGRTKYVASAATNSY